MFAGAEAARAGLRGDVIVTAVCDEEVASIGTARVVERYRADAAIVSEPTEMRLVLAHKGFVGFEIETKGRAAHGSRPDLGIDAIARMGHVLVGHRGARPAAARRSDASAARQRLAPRVPDRGRAGVLQLPGALPPQGRAAHRPGRDGRARRGRAAGAPGRARRRDQGRPRAAALRDARRRGDRPARRPPRGEPRGRRRALLGGLGPARGRRHPYGRLRPCRRGRPCGRRVGRPDKRRALRGGLHGGRPRALRLIRPAFAPGSDPGRGRSSQEISPQAVKSARPPATRNPVGRLELAIHSMSRPAVPWA